MGSRRIRHGLAAQPQQQKRICILLRVLYNFKRRMISYCLQREWIALQSWLRVESVVSKDPYSAAYVKLIKMKFLFSHNVQLSTLFPIAPPKGLLLVLLVKNYCSHFYKDIIAINYLMEVTWCMMRRTLYNGFVMTLAV